jgi:uncharacterized protein YhaN
VRLLDLHLKAFGPFTDRRLDLSGGSEGLHVVFGPNEAGKSSALRALKALLYGIPVRSADNFLHPYDQLRIGARLLLKDGRELAILRRKGTKGTLLAPDNEEPLDDQLLAPCLQGMEEALFSSVFGIDHDALVQGGEELREQKGDVGQALFAAGLGTRNLRRVLLDLEKEADALFVPRGSTRVIHRATAELELAKKDLREATLSGREWEEHRRELEEAERELASVQIELEGAKRERQRLQRMRLALPLLGKRRELRGQREALGAVVVLPAGFGAERRELAADLRAAREAQARAMAERERLLVERGTVLPAPAIHEHAEAIEHVQQELGRYKKDVGDRSKRLAERSEARTAAQGLLEDTWPEITLDEAETLRPALARWPRIQELGPRRDGLVREAEQAQRGLAEAERRHLATRDALAALPARRDSSALRAAVDAARRAGDLDGEIAQAALRVRTEEERARRELDRLGWPGTLDELEALPVPPVAAIQRFDSAFAALAEQDRARLDDRRKAQADLAEAERELDAIRREGSVPSEDDLAAARDRRDHAWIALRRKFSVTAADAYEPTVQAADELADRLRREAARVHENARQAARRDSLQRILADLDRAEITAMAERDRLEKDWRSLWSPCRIEPLPPREMHPGWTGRHERLLERAETLRTLREALHVLESQATRHRGALLRELHTVTSANPIATATTVPAKPVETPRGEPRGASPRSHRGPNDPDILKADAGAERAATSEHRTGKRSAIPESLDDGTGDFSAGDAPRGAPRGVSTWGAGPYGLGEGETLERILIRCDVRVRDLEAVERNREALTAGLRELEERLAEAREEREAAVTALETWRAVWAEAVRDLGLPKEALPGEANQTLERLRELFGRLKAAADLDRRIAGLDRDTAGVQAAVRDLASRVAPDLVDRPVETAVLQLAALLTEARRQATRLAEMDRRARDLNEEIRQSEETAHAREARLVELRREARAEDDSGLDEAERRSLDALRLDEEISNVQDQLLAAGEGATLDELEREAGEIDALALPGRLEETEGRIEELERRKGDLRQKIGSEEGELRRRDGGDGAARAAERVQEILARLRGHVEQYTRARLASVLLQREIERYRAENQDPLLARAGQLFADLTIGRYSGLRTDFDDREQPILVGLRADGRRVPVEALSDGTRDQLYLALRLATLERYLAHAEPLPFIVDDILINFDDERTAATLKVLAELSKKTQVILFTHHGRLKEMAAGMRNGAGVFVRELG